MADNATATRAAEGVCAYSGNDRCAFLLSGEHHEQLEVMRHRFSSISDDLKHIVHELKEMVVQNRESQRELIDVLRGRAPSTYVPLSVYFITIAVALGVDRIEQIIQLLKHLAGIR